MNEKIRDRQLVERLAQFSGVEPAFMREFLKEVLSLIEEGLLRDGVVRIHNFGTFRLRWTEARPGINPATGEKMMISARGRVVFQPAKNLREMVNLFHRPAAPEIAAETEVRPRPLERPLVPEPLSAVPVMEEPMPEEFDIAEVLPETTRVTKPVFVFDDIAVDQAPVVSETGSELDRLLEAPPRRRSKRFAWMAGSLAIFLLLLLFVFVDRISERQQSPPPPIATTTPSATSAPTSISESAAPTNGINASTDGHAKATKGLSKSSSQATPFFAGGTHRVSAGDNLWGISGAYYHDHYLWPNIYRVNTATVKNPDMLQIEQQLELPALYGSPENLTPTDRRDIAEGYFLLYRYYKENEAHLAPYALWAAVQYDQQVKIDHAAELSEDDLAFLQAHEVRRVMAER